jgi:hypothetical protein
VKAAFDYTDPGTREALEAEVLAGFDDFAREHDEFFASNSR